MNRNQGQVPGQGQAPEQGQVLKLELVLELEQVLELLLEQGQALELGQFQGQDTYHPPPEPPVQPCFLHAGQSYLREI